MAFEITKWCMVCTAVSVVLLCTLTIRVVGEPQVPCFFIFGDSIVDNGNNNNLVTLAKSNYPPYGVDTPTRRPTGRFTNNRTIVDITGELLGFKDYIPPYEDSHSADVLVGMNYASAAAGIRDETGQQLGARISFNNQLRNHQDIISRITNILGSNESTTSHLNKCLYYVGLGNNDYINNYLKPLFYSSSHKYTPQQFAEVLIQQYSEQIKTLYNYGAKKVALYSLLPVGCTPNEIASYGTNGALCVEKINAQVVLFNNRLRSLVDELNNNFTDAKFVYVNLYDLALAAIFNPAQWGFKVTNRACCGVGPYNGIACMPLQIPCHNRTEYLFWDAFHPSEASNMIMAQRTYHDPSLNITYPMDIYTLAQLQ
ncbi:GDSL-lipase protein [Heracleum sosnowskyi]|uniref:GDSL-lipase protein n=1 Tax=Heracleum sosnowskyi TaxID=360622 RepID=A0AAD8HZS9_9APIA|nr:GDSL-lipase protein [Heracleum sosnowskyi]